MNLFILLISLFVTRSAMAGLMTDMCQYAPSKIWNALPDPEWEEEIATDSATKEAVVASGVTGAAGAGMIAQATKGGKSAIYQTYHYPTKKPMLGARPGFVQKHILKLRHHSFIPNTMSVTAAGASAASYGGALLGATAIILGSYEGTCYLHGIIRG